MRISTMPLTPISVKATIDNDEDIPKQCDPKNPLTKRYIDVSLAKIFDKYASKTDPNVMDFHGIESYLLDLKHPGGYGSKFGLAYFMRSASCDSLTKRKFCGMWRQREVIYWREMVNMFRAFELLLMSEFCHDVPEFTFDYMRPTRGLVKYSIAAEYGELLLGRYWESRLCWDRVKQWCFFVSARYQKDTDKETWLRVVPFFKEVVYKDREGLSGFRACDWPDMMSEFVMYLCNEDLITRNASSG